MLLTLGKPVEKMPCTTPPYPPTLAIKGMEGAMTWVLGKHVFLCGTPLSGLNIGLSILVSTYFDHSNQRQNGVLRQHEES